MAAPGPPTERIIVVPEVVAFGGAERSVLALSRWLHATGRPHRFLCYWDRIGLGRHAVHPIVVTELAPRPSVIAKILALRRFAAGLSGSTFLMSGYQAALHGAVAGLGGFHTLMHDTPSLLGDGAHPTGLGALRRAAATRVLRFGLRRGGRTIVTSEYLKEESDRLYGTTADIIRMGGHTPHVPFRPRRVEGRLRLLSVSRLEANKRIDWILRALATCSDGLPWQLDIVGDGTAKPDMVALAARLGLGDRVAFHGFVDDAALSTLFDSAHLFLMPARQGYGIPAIEALDRGIPVLLHRDSGVSDILGDTPWCTVVSGGEENLAPALARAMAAVTAGRHIGHSRPAIPTEDQWAEAVAAACGWL